MSGILSYKVWMIDLSYADRLAPFILSAIKNNTYDSFVQHNREKSERKLAGFYSGLETEKIRESADEPMYYTATAKNGLKVAIMPMMGAITKNGDACSWGWRDYQNILSRIEKNPNIAGVVFHFNNTPGGSHDGTPEFAYNIRSMKKANVGFADGYAASAHYYALSQTNHIMVNERTPTELGSIGAYMLYQNIQNQIDAGEYPTMKIIRAPQSTDKVKMNFLEPLTEELETAEKEMLKGLVKTFIADVKKGRGAALKTDEVFTGAMYNESDSLKHGLADSKGSLQDAINLAAKMASGKKTISTSAPGKAGASNTEMKFPKLSKLFSGEAWNKVLSAFTEDEAQLEATEKVVADMEAEISTLKTEKAALAEKGTAHEAKVTELTTQVQKLEGEVSTLKSEKQSLQTQLDAKPAGHATTAVAESDSAEAVEEVSKYRTSVDDEVAKYASVSNPKSK